jgi:hypothetical protein
MHFSLSLCLSLSPPPLHKTNYIHSRGQNTAAHCLDQIENRLQLTSSVLLAGKEFAPWGVLAVAITKHKSKCPSVNPPVEPLPVLQLRTHFWIELWNPVPYPHLLCVLGTSWKPEPASYA